MPSTGDLQDAGIPTTVEHGGQEPLEAEATCLMLTAVPQSPQWRRVENKQVGVSIGESMAPVPRKMAEKIWR